MKCQVADCDNDAEWSCSQSKMRYCDDHKHPHGNPPHTFIKIRRKGGRSRSEKTETNG